MEDHPAVAAKGKKDSSMRVAFDLAKERRGRRGRVGGQLGRDAGVRAVRDAPAAAASSGPGIVTTFPDANGVCALIDMGANVECRPETLAQFAVLGAVYARLLHGKARPRVGLLSNGEEAIKGTELTRGAYKLLVGRGREGLRVRRLRRGARHLRRRRRRRGHRRVHRQRGAQDVEGAAAAIDAISSARSGRRRWASWARSCCAARSGASSSVLDVDEHGGAPLVGVDGIAVLCHGAARRAGDQERHSRRGQLRRGGAAGGGDAGDRQARAAVVRRSSAGAKRVSEERNNDAERESQGRGGRRRTRC